MRELEKKVWWDYLERDLQELLNEAFMLLNILKGMGADLRQGKDKFHDYSFITFPAAKAYEGFLKKVFLDLGFISEDDYFGKHFRIGMALNPSLPTKLRRNGVYEKIVKHCGGKDLADNLWETWKMSRNQTFHWFPNEKNAITFSEAQGRIEMIVQAIDQVFTECKL